MQTEFLIDGEYPKFEKIIIKSFDQELSIDKHQIWCSKVNISRRKLIYFLILKIDNILFVCFMQREREVAQSCPILHDPMDCSLPGSSVHGIFQARVLEWGAIAFSDNILSAIINALYVIFTLKNTPLI